MKHVQGTATATSATGAVESIPSSRCAACGAAWPCDSALLDWIEAVSVVPIEIDNFGADWPCFLTISDGGPDERDTRFQAVGLRAVLRKAMAQYQATTVMVRVDGAALDDLPASVRAELEARLKADEAKQAKPVRRSDA